MSRFLKLAAVASAPAVVAGENVYVSSWGDVIAPNTGSSIKIEQAKVEYTEVNFWKHSQGFNIDAGKLETPPNMLVYRVQEPRRSGAVSISRPPKRA